MRTTKRSRRRRALKSWSRHNTPEELWPEILSRLPAKSLVRFRSVSKSWKSMIDDPDFVRLHLNRFNNGADSGLFFVTGSSRECVVKNNKNLRTSRSLGFLQSDLESLHVLRTTPAPARLANHGSIRFWSISSSIDGLLLLNRERSDLMLWNPSIKKTLVLPPLEIPQISRYVDFGLGFDPSIMDYKCVRFGAMSVSNLKIAAIYTLGTNSWKTIEFQGDVRRDIVLDGGKRIVPFDGALYALAKDTYPDDRPVKLVSFDLRREVCASMELPVAHGHLNEHSVVYDQALTMVDDDVGCGCSLGVVNLTRPEGSVWILQRFGDDSKSWSWVPRYTFVLAPQLGCHVQFCKFLCMTKSREMLWTFGKLSVICYNLETQQEKWLLEKNQKTLHQGHVFPYVESLALLHH